MPWIAAALWGALAGWWTPRGPLTGTQAVCSVVVSTGVGFLAGRRSRPRWVFLIVPAVFWVALELVRLPLHGPSVDAPHGSVFGVLVLLAGRGVQAIFTVLPMVVATTIGRGVTGRLGRFLIALPAAAVLLLTAAVAVPARTAPLRGGVAELRSVGGLDVMIRGDHADAPVLLFVPGAPGGSELGAVREHLSGLERRFVVATLDRRGGGASYPALDPTAKVTLDGAVDDVLRVTDYLRQRFHQNKIYLLGHSGGSLLAVLAVDRHPERYAAYIGTGQAVDLPASDRIFYDDILVWARQTGHRAVADQLVAQGPPPYADVWGYEPFMLYENQAYGQQPTGFGLGVREYTLLQKVHTVNAILDTWDVLYPRMQGADLRRDVPALSVPAYFIQGSNEMRGLSVLFTQWYGELRDPVKRLYVIPGADHRAIFERPDRLEAVMDDVLAAG